MAAERDRPVGTGTGIGPTRRNVLLAGAALTVGAMCNRLPLLSDQPVVRVRRGAFHSDHWPGRRINWVVCRPERSQVQAPLVLALHSLGTSANWFVERLDAPGVARRTGLTIAAVDGGRHYWHGHENGIDTATMVLEDFLPRLAEMGLDTTRLGLTGVSMGGFGVLRLATVLPPEQVQGIAVVAPALRRSYWENRTLAFDDRAAFEANNPFNHVDALRRFPVCIACGKQDSFYPASRAMARQLRCDATLFTPGGHSTRYVASHWEPVMRWLSFTMQPQLFRP